MLNVVSAKFSEVVVSGAVDGWFVVIAVVNSVVTVVINDSVMRGSSVTVVVEKVGDSVESEPVVIAMEVVVVVTVVVVCVSIY